MLKMLKCTTTSNFLKNLNFNINKTNTNTISTTHNFIKTPKRFIYYDNIEFDRNLDFVFNLGYNDIPSKIKPDIGMIKLVKFLSKRKFLYLIKHYYKNLLESIEKGEIQIFDEILEKNLKFNLYSDLKSLYGLNLNFKVVNKSSPIFLKILNIYELQNVSSNREINGEISEYDLKYEKNGSVIRLAKYDPYEELKREGKSIMEIQKEKNEFEKSNYFDVAMEKLNQEAKLNYGMEYLRSKLGNDVHKKGSEYMSQIITLLESNETNNDPYSIELKTQFNDYFLRRDKFIENKIKNTDLFDYFRVTMPKHYKAFYELFNAKTGIIKRAVNWFRKIFYKKYIFKSKKISREKTLYVVDVEITSKMRLEIIDSNGNNALDSVYSYCLRMKRNLGKVGMYNNGEDDLINYDTSIYNFTVPDRKWNFNNKNFMQTHVLRFEFERKNKFQNIFKKPYENLVISDIDMSLKGNKHFKFNKDYLI